MDELIEAGDGDEWLRYDPDEERPEEADPQPWHQLYFEAWGLLRFDRQYGAFGGEAPISYLTLSSYARDRGIGGADLLQFVRLMNAIDDEWLRYQAEVAETKAKEQE